MLFIYANNKTPVFCIFFTPPALSCLAGTSPVNFCFTLGSKNYLKAEFLGCWELLCSWGCEVKQVVLGPGSTGKQLLLTVAPHGKQKFWHTVP